MTQNKRETLNLRKAKTPITLNKISKDSKTPLMLKVEERLGKDIREFLKQNYVEKGLSWDKIAKVTRGVSPKTLWKWGRKFGIKSRNTSGNEPDPAKEQFRNTNEYEHIACCLCLSCQETSNKCSYIKTHKRGYCIFSCPNYK